MTFDEITLWLVTAMGFAAVFLLCWTLAAVVRASRPVQFAIEAASGHAGSDARNGTPV